jgi:hypothetical protein
MVYLFWGYLAVYATIVVVNCLYWVLLRQKLVLVLYALTAGLYLTFLGVAYFSPLLRDCLSLYNVPLMLVILAVDFHSTFKWRKLDIKTVFPHMDEELARLARKYQVIELAKSVPTLISAPLYIIGLLMAFEVLKSHLTGS